MKNVRLNLTNKVKDLSVENGKSPEDTEKGEEKQNSSEVAQLKSRIAELEQSIDKKQKQAYEAGVQDGRNEVIEKAEAELKEYAQEFISSLNNAEEQLQDLFKKAEEPLMNLALNISEKIIKRELSQKNDYEEFLSKELKAIGQKFRNQENITIRINPGQRETIKEFDLVKYFNNARKEGIKCISDSSLEPGECIVETKNIKIDNTISRQLENIKKKLTDNE